MTFPCPACRSRNTQRTPVAYEQSVRRGGRYRTVSSFGARIAPPDPLEGVYQPTVVLLLVSIASWLSMPTWIDEFPSLVAFVEQHGTFGRYLLAFAIGGFSATPVLLVTVVREVKARPQKLRAWESSWVCRSCGEQFWPKDRE